MAANMICDICGQVPADFVITLIHNGDTMAVGAECAKAWGDSVAESLAQAEARDQAGATPAPQPPGGDVGDWEDGYPQRGREPAQEPPEGGSEAVGEDTEASTPADVDG